MRILLAVVAAVLVAGCSPHGGRGPEDLSKPHYIPFSSVRECAFTWGYYPELKLCFRNNGASSRAVERQKKYFGIGVAKWMEALREIDSRITNKVAFSCDDPHFEVTVNPGSGVATSGCGQANVFERESSDNGSGDDLVLQGTTLHELGHGLAGLSDTYQGRQAGDCKPGQPESIMCWGGYGSRKDSEGYKTLYDDDVTGIQSQFKKFKNFMNIPAGGLPPEGGGTGGPDAPPVDQLLTAAIAPLTNNSISQLLAVATTVDSAKVTLCDKDNLQTCDDPYVAPAAALTYKAQMGDRFFHIRSGLVPEAGKTYTILIWKSKGKAVGMRSFRFKAK